MGRVRCARDGKLDRDVAIKVLPEAFAHDTDRLARFTREAKTLASLSHPNIASIYGLEESGGVTALVMELVAGDDLSQRIARGAITMDEALPIARQIADALEAAHEQGIIHRDLKPANIKVRQDGTVKVLDFGLAKAMDPAGASSANAMNSPTLSMHATQAGIILGTAAYMSPEQAAGKAVDRRSDLWAFGVVLLEMLTGRQVFAGETVTHVLASVLKDAPDWTGLPAQTPAPIRQLLRRCLEKDRKRRLDSAADARLEIEDALSAPAAAGQVIVARPARTAVLPWSLVTLLAIAIGGAWWSGVGRNSLPNVYASIDGPADHVLGEDDPGASLPTRTPMVFTPDGRALIIQAAHAGRPQLFLRALDRAEPKPIAGTDDARVPFVSPDGHWLGFWAGGTLQKVPIEGGTPTAICPLKAILGPFGASWGSGDVIVYGDEASGRIMRVSAAGGTPAPVTALPQLGRRHVAPLLFPDGKRILFSDVSSIGEDAGGSRLMVQSLDGNDARQVIASASDGRLLPSGHLLFMRLGALMSVPFDAARGEPRGDAVVAMGGVMQSGLRGRAGADYTAAGMFAVSSLGTLAFLRGTLIGADAHPMIWTTRDGRSSSAESTSGAPMGRRGPSRISPDGSRAIVALDTPSGRQLWIADWKRDAWIACGDCRSDIGTGVWSQDGARLLLAQNDGIVAHAIDGSTPDQILVREAGRRLIPFGWLRDGGVVYESYPDKANSEIRVLDAGGRAGRVEVALGLGFAPEVSPDGRWLAYESPRPGAGEIVVQAFPGPGSRVQVSAGGGFNPAWSRDGRTLYYLGVPGPGGGSSVMMEADISAGPVLSAGKPRELFRRPESQRCSPRCYDVSADGQRFLLRDRTTAPRVSVSRMDLVSNWTAGLKK